jgi:glutamate dehydrogenase (NAD(P)+)
MSMEIHGCMIELSEKMEETQLVCTVAEGSDMMGYVAIDSTIGGSARGGLRLSSAVRESEIRELARSMTLKCGFLGQPQGGAKAGVRCDPEAPLAERWRCLAAFGQAIAPLLLNRTYIPGPDMGTTHADIQYLLQIVGVPVKRQELVNAYTGYYTAVTVVAGMRQATRFLGMDLSACRVAIEGFGKVGMALANLLDEAQARVVAVSTSLGAIYNPNGLDVKRLTQLAAEVGSRVVDLYADAERISCGALLELPVDVLCPCAERHSLHMGNASHVAARIICAGANNPIVPEAECLLFERGVLCLPDFVTNSGGVLGGTMAFASIAREQIVSLIEQRLGARIAWLLSEAARNHKSPRDIAVPIARQRFEEMRRLSANPTLPSRLLDLSVTLYSRGWIPGALVARMSWPYFERKLA